jgi:hypothetical protein
MEDTEANRQALRTITQREWDAMTPTMRYNRYRLHRAHPELGLLNHLDIVSKTPCLSPKCNRKRIDEVYKKKTNSHCSPKRARWTTQVASF